MLNCESAEKLSTEYNIDNLVVARFKFVSSNAGSSYWRVFTFISLKKHVLAMGSAIKVKGQSANSNMTDKSCQWLCIENWIDWQKFNSNTVATAHNFYYSTSTVNLTVVEEKSFTAEKIYEDLDLTDFTLKTSDGSVSVHKAWLSAHSDVFKAMLRQEWKETAEGHVKIEGVTLQTLQHLKQYMYLGKLPDDGLHSLLLLAMYYLMDELKTECISKLAHTASSENLDNLLNFAIDNKVPELTFAILEMTPRDVVQGAYELRKAKAVSEKEL